MVTKLKHLTHFRRSFSGERIVRVPLGKRGKTYSYVCAGDPRIGSLVRVNTPINSQVIVPVVGFGRGNWFGPLKRATLIHR